MWLVGGIYGYGYHVYVWLVGVVVRRYIDILIIIINFPYSTCISSFFCSSIPTSLFIFKMFFQSCFCYFFTAVNSAGTGNYSNSTSAITSGTFSMCNMF